MRFSFLLFALFSTMFLHAQVSQNGLVKEYNEKLAKKPLGNVEVVATNAGSVVTNNKGEFILQFRTLKPGERVNIRRIEKLGYEIFNKEALEQWNINPNEPFVIVMCRNELFKKIRDNYTKVSSDSYARQLKKEEEKLKQERDAGKINEQKYQQQLTELVNQYQQQLEDIDNYIDKFARIDLSELSEKEQKIIELVQNGDIDAAIRKYEEENFLSKYKKETNDLKELEIAKRKIEQAHRDKVKYRKEIQETIIRQANAYILAGGKENYAKVTTLLNEMALSDTTNVYTVLLYANYAFNQNNFPEAIKFYKIALNNTDSDNDLRIQVIENLALAYQNNRYFTESLACYQEVLNTLPKESEKYIHCLENMATLYTYTADYKKAIECYEQSIIFYESMELDQYVIEALAVSYRNYGILLSNLNDLEKAQACLLKAASLLEQFDNKGTVKFALYSESTLSMLGQVYIYMQKFDEAKEILEKAMPVFDQLVNHNPEAYLDDMLAYKNSLAQLYFYLQEYEHTEKLFLECIDALNELSKTAYNRYIPMKAETYQNLGYLSYTIKEYTKSEEYYLLASSIFMSEMEKNQDFPNAYRKELGRIYVNMSLLYMDMNAIDKSLNYAQGAIDFLNEFYQDMSGFTCDIYAWALKNMAICNSLKGAFDEAISFIDKAISIAPVESLKCSKITCYEVKGDIYLDKGDQSAAKRVLKKILEIDSTYVEKNQSEFIKRLSLIDK